MNAANVTSILVTGGAGFVGSSLAERFHADGYRVTVMDNLMRKGSELNAERIRAAGIGFVQGDIRVQDDWDRLPAFDLIIDCAAEPSVHAGASSSPMLVIETNLNGTVLALEKARKDGSAFVFLSTSRVYSIPALLGIRLDETPGRFEIAGRQILASVSAAGIAEDFPRDTYRSFYGTTKLASEQLIQEYAAFYGLRAIINRCGVIAGPYQMGKVDQGVTALWVARHYYGLPLKYIGFGGRGQQVRDVLHPADLYDLLALQLAGVDAWKAEVFNVGGGREISFSLSELTVACREITGRSVDIASVPETTAVDVPLYISDCRNVQAAYGWKPRHGVMDIVRDIHAWIDDDADALRSVFC